MNKAEKEIQDNIGHVMYRRGHSPITFNFLGAGLGECDVITISPAGFIYEFEIKTSRSDFKADFKKSWKHKELAERNIITKYDEFKNGKRTGILIPQIRIPNYFYYVTPKDLIKDDELPEYAGLLYDTDHLELEAVKKAPRLHSHICNDLLLKAIARNLTCKLLYGCSYMKFKNDQFKHKLTS